jgi:HEAT repeat protein
MKRFILGIGISVLAFLLFWTPLRAEFVPPPGDQMAQFKDLCEKRDAAGLIKFLETYGSENRPRRDQWEWNSVVEQTLLTLPRETLLPALRQGLNSDKPFVADFCAYSLVNFKDKAALEQTIAKISLTDEQRKTAVQLAKDLGSSDYRTRFSAHDTLITMGPAVLEIILPLTKDKNPVVAESAKEISSTLSRSLLPIVIVLEGLADQSALPGIRALLKMQILDDSMVGPVVLKLCNLGTQDDLLTIREYLNTDFRRYAMGGLARLKDKESVPALVKLISDPKDGNDAIITLGAIGDARAIKPLEAEMARDGDSMHMTYCADALARLGVKKYLDELVDKQPDNAYAWGQWFYHLTPKDAETVLKRTSAVKSPSTLARIASYMSQNYFPFGDEKAIKVVRELRKRVETMGPLDDAFAGMFSVALMRMGDGVEVKTLLEHAGDKDRDVRYRALLALWQSQNEKYLPLFINALDNLSDTPLNGQRDEMNDRIRQLALIFVQIISKESFEQWNGDPKRQVKEIKAWYAKYLKEKAAPREAFQH